MNRLILILMLTLTVSLFSLEINLNNRLFDNYTDEMLLDLSYELPDGNRGIYLKELLPLMKEVHQFQFYSGDYILETDPSEDLKILITSEGNRLTGDKIGMIPLPRLVEIRGIARMPEKVVIWMGYDDPALKREINSYASLHNISVQYRVEEGIVSLLEYNLFNDRPVPDLLIFSDEKLNNITPLLSLGSQSETIPFKFNRQLFLTKNAMDKDLRFTADFGDMNIFYPLLMHFELEEPLSLDDMAFYKTFEYLKRLYQKGQYMILGTTYNAYEEGDIEAIYGSSHMIGLTMGSSVDLPQTGESPVPPMKVRTLLTTPPGAAEKEISEDLIAYLTGYGVQQRISPESGFLPINRNVYHLLEETPSKEMMMDNLEMSITVPSNDTMDKLREALPVVYRLVVTGRLTIEEGIKEIRMYVESSESQ